MEVSDYYNYDGSKTLDSGTLQSGNGTRITYDSNETEESEGQYKSGQASGEWKYYHDNGRLASAGEMVDGKKEGPWTYYGRNGAVSDLVNYKDDEIVQEENPVLDLMFRNFN